MELIVRPEAEQDLAEASDWYGERESGLRTKFVAKVEGDAGTDSRTSGAVSPHREIHEPRFRDFSGSGALQLPKMGFR